MEDDRSHQQSLRDGPASFEEVSKALQGPGYQNLAVVVRETVTELATLCAEMEVYSYECVEQYTYQRGNKDGETAGSTEEKRTSNDSPDVR